MTARNQFQFAKNRKLADVTVLHAAMDDFTYDKHAHEEYSIGVTLSGRQDFFSQGVFHRSHPGNVIFISPGAVHDGCSGGDDDLHYSMLYIHPREFEPLLESAGVRQARDFQIRDMLLQNETLRRNVLALAELFSEQSPSSAELELAFYQIAASIARGVGQYEADSVVRRVDTMLLKARDYIHAHLKDDLALDDLSQVCHLSKYHFLRLFRQQFGITPHQYILNCRINEARRALESGQPPDDVAYDFGFSDVSHFNRRFKPIYGMTPHQYQLNVTGVSRL
ncbi:AraC family transcriptional regulator [Hahella sp. CCB-MM4]|uniref:helix-turn-helix transcriptional regulator n=1 Tax=Hahella sp. (strain CCB-MM4) TaxID=1926491 RepID=UPI000B9B011E|nr:AraC family transcriptional regulator [Hahella sp. CCB-MM4]OZG70210.1 AraC family transcriptional regulator [Hahella sp. CCB-MM4]